MNNRLDKLTEKLFFLSHIPSNLGLDEICITLTTDELDLIVMTLKEYIRLKESEE